MHPDKIFLNFENIVITAFILADVSGRSPRKVFILIMKEKYLQEQSVLTTFHLGLKTQSLLTTLRPQC